MPYQEVGGRHQAGHYTATGGVHLHGLYRLRRFPRIFPREKGGFYTFMMQDGPGFKASKDILTDKVEGLVGVAVGLIRPLASERDNYRDIILTSLPSFFAGSPMKRQ